jgi:preprotein translocase subunit Sss1
MDNSQLYKHILKEEYDEAMNKLSIYERAVIKNVRQKIWEDEFWGNVFNEKEKDRQKREEERRLREEERRLKEEYEAKRKEQRKSTKIKAVGILCVGTIVYSCAMLITR